MTKTAVPERGWTEAQIERASLAIDAAWNDGGAPDLPPIEFTSDERRHLAIAALEAALTPSTESKNG